MTVTNGYGGSLTADNWGGSLELFSSSSSIVVVDGLLYDQDSGSFLYDDVTGAPLKV